MECCRKTVEVKIAMKVLHSSIMDASSGGPAMSTYFTVEGIRKLGIDAEVITYE